MKNISLKMDDHKFGEMEEILSKINKSRNRYINEAIDFYNLTICFWLIQILGKPTDLVASPNPAPAVEKLKPQYLLDQGILFWHVFRVATGSKNILKKFFYIIFSYRRKCDPESVCEINQTCLVFLQQYLPYRFTIQSLS